MNAIDTRLLSAFWRPVVCADVYGHGAHAFGEGLVMPLRAALDALDVVLGHSEDFDPSVADRTFRICMTDISQLVLLPKLLGKLRVSGPSIGVEIFPLSDNMEQMLESGEADLALGFIPQLETRLYQQLLFKQNFVCMVSLGHPRIKKQLHVQQFESEKHAVISYSGSAPQIVDQEIAKPGLKRLISLRILNFLGAAFVVEHTELILTIPECLGDVLKERGAFSIFSVPFALPSYDVKQHWHERHHHDPASKWLRGVISELLSPQF